MNTKYKTLYFIHIPRTGGSYVTKIALCHVINVLDKESLRVKLYKFLHGDINFRIGRSKVFKHNHPVCTDKLLDTGGFTRAYTNTCVHSKKFQNSFVFSIVRNPFDLLLSMYKYGFPYSRPRPNNPKKGKYFPFDSFEEFIFTYCDTDSPWLVKPQQKFLFFQLFGDNGNCKADILLRTEYLDEGLKFLCEPFGIKPKISSNHINPTDRHKDYKKYYTNEMRKAVEQKCRRELEAFCYNFDGCTGSPQIYPKHIKYNSHL